MLDELRELADRATQMSRSTEGRTHLRWLYVSLLLDHAARIIGEIRRLELGRYHGRRYEEDER